MPRNRGATLWDYINGVPLRAGTEEQQYLLFPPGAGAEGRPQAGQPPGYVTPPERDAFLDGDAPLFVESSWLAWAVCFRGFQETSQEVLCILTLGFKDRFGNLQHIQPYAPQPVSLAREFVAAQSKGVFVHRRILDKYDKTSKRWLHKIPMLEGEAGEMARNLALELVS